MKKRRLLLIIIVFFIFFVYTFIGLFYLYIRLGPKLNLKKTNTVILYDKEKEKN